MTRLRTIINTKNNKLKLFALVAGYHIWIMYRSWLPTTVTVPLPVYAYNVPTSKTVTVSDYLNVTLHGTYRALCSLDEHAGVHIDAGLLPLGSSKIPVTKTALLLPRTMSVLHYSPTVIEVTVQDCPLPT